MVAPQVPFTALAPVLSVKSKLPEEYEPATPARMSGHVLSDSDLVVTSELTGSARRIPAN